MSSDTTQSPASAGTRTGPSSSPSSAVAAREPAANPTHARSRRRDAELERELERIEDDVLCGRRVERAAAQLLHDHANLTLLGRLADHVRWRLHPRPVVTYIVDRNLNPTNVCITDCGFCAFYRRPGADGAYVLSREEIDAKVEETARLGGRQLLMQGGHHPYLKTAWWCELIAHIAERWPQINCHALSAPELDHLAKLDRQPVEHVIAELKAAGLGSVPGAGAEVLVERVRKLIAPKKITTERWLDVHRKVHGQGLRSSATLMFGHVETAEERVEHLLRVRELQDETGGFTAFACWLMQPDGVPEAHMYPQRGTPGTYLRVQALARIVLDNVANIQTSYVTQGLDMAQITLRYGCNDFGGTMLEENVVSAAGCFHLAPVRDIEHQITRAGLVPRQRNSWYGIVDARHDDTLEGPRGPQRAADAPPHGTEAMASSRDVGARERAQAS